MRSGPRSLRCALLLLALSGHPSRLAAQASTDAERAPRWRLGPVSLNPSVVFKDIGIDSNVFNEGAAREDFTATVNPMIEATVRLGQARVTGRSSTDFVYFRTYKDQQSANRKAGGQFEVRLNRLRPFASGEILRTRERPSEEIDSRARRFENAVAFGFDVRFSRGATLVVSAGRTGIDFPEGEAFRGIDLGRALNRRVASASAALRLALTPLMTLVIEGEAQRHRFLFSRIRDADGLRIAPAIEIRPGALLSGGASLGYRKFHARGDGVPDYTGAVAAVGLAYTLLEETRFELRFDRDVAYSFEVLEPYYLSTGGTARVSRRIVGPFELVATAGRQRLAYRSVENASAEERRDTVETFGAGLGYRLGSRARFSLLAEHSERRSNSARGRGYVRTTVFGSVTYGF